VLAYVLLSPAVHGKAPSLFCCVVSQSAASWSTCTCPALGAAISCLAPDVTEYGVCAGNGCNPSSHSAFAAWAIAGPASPTSAISQAPSSASLRDRGRDGLPPGRGSVERDGWDRMAGSKGDA